MKAAWDGIICPRAIAERVLALYSKVAPVKFSPMNYVVQLSESCAPWTMSPPTMSDSEYFSPSPTSLVHHCELPPMLQQTPTASGHQLQGGHFGEIWFSGTVAKLKPGFTT
jgi:hypothetical protein